MLNMLKSTCVQCLFYPKRGDYLIKYILNCLAVSHTFFLQFFPSKMNLPTETPYLCKATVLSIDTSD